MADLSDLITRQYANFKGVDFTNNDVKVNRSPDALNMWKVYDDSDCVQTRPGMKFINQFDNDFLGIHFLNKNNKIHCLVHIGTKLFEWNNYPETPVEITEKYVGMNIVESKSFVYDNTLFIKDGINYLEYDGEEVKEVAGTIPITSYYRNPNGSTSIDEDTDTDLVYQAVNCLTSFRKNVFIADGTSTDYYLDAQGLDSPTIYLMEAVIYYTGSDGTPREALKIENIDFKVDRELGIVKFDVAPQKDAEVMITYSKIGDDHLGRILNCTLLCEFDNRIFFSGNPNYPNAVFHTELNDPRYVRDTAYYECGLNLADVKALIPGNNALWVIKDIEQNSSSVYYMTPTLDNQFAKIYPSVNGSISLGCVSTGINFNDDIVFFSKRGLESVANSSIYSEQLLQHRSSLVDTKLLSEKEYKDIKLAEYKGYLMCLVNSHIYLADSRKRVQMSSNEVEYEWFYWELPYNINFIKEYRGNLYLGNKDGQLFILDGTTDNEEDILSYWTTPKDDFGYPSYTKTTNKRGNVADLKVMNNDEIHVDTIVDGKLKEKTTLADKKGYIAYRIKDKKFKDIQIKFSSNKPFGLFSCTLQGFVAGYIKR